MADEPKLIVNGREYPMPDSFTMGELADMEQITGQGYDLSKGGVRAMLALTYVAIKRIDPRVTVEDIRALGQDDFEIVGGDDVPPVLSGPGDSPTETAKPSRAGSASRSSVTPPASNAPSNASAHPRRASTTTSTKPPAEH